MKYHVFFFGGRSEARAASGTIRLEKAILLSPEFCHHLQTVPFVIIITIFIIIIVIVITIFTNIIVIFIIIKVIFIIINVIIIIINDIFIILITFCQNATICKVSHLPLSSSSMSSSSLSMSSSSSSSHFARMLPVAKCHICLIQTLIPPMYNPQTFNTLIFLLC